MEVDPKWIRVSSILGIMPTLGSDGKWGFPMNQLDQEMLRRKADVGSAVHNAIATYVKDEFYVIDEREQGYLDSFIKWEMNTGLKAQEVEKRFYYEPMNLTGCVDMIGKLAGDAELRLIDFKCTVAPDHKKWQIQAAFYHFLAQRHGYKLDPLCLFVQLNPDGGIPKVHDYEITKELSSTAISLYNAYIYLTRS